jgi:hypothetical protein
MAAVAGTFTSKITGIMPNVIRMCRSGSIEKHPEAI